MDRTFTPLLRNRWCVIFAKSAAAIETGKVSAMNDKNFHSAPGSQDEAAPLSATSVVDLAERHLGIAPEMVINEYGMTEMCSQLYDATPFNSTRRESIGERCKLPPPWLRPFAVDPATLRPVADGQPGMLTFFDLANVGSV